MFLTQWDDCVNPGYVYTSMTSEECGVTFDLNQDYLFMGKEYSLYSFREREPGSEWRPSCGVLTLRYLIEIFSHLELCSLPRSTTWSD